MNYIELFKASVLQHPDSPALIDRCGKRTVSYAELDRLSSCAAGKLHALGCAPGSFIGICMDRRMEYIAAYLGILKAGCAVVPMVPDYPQERKDYICSHCSAALTVKEDFFEDVEKYAPYDVPADGKAPALLVYTSGSTGTPKGILYTAEDLARTAGRQTALLEGLPELDFAAACMFSFIAHITEYLSVFLMGGCSHILPDEVRRSADHLAQYYADHGITAGVITTQLMRLFHSRSTALRRVLTGSERVSRIYSDSFEIYNVYGMSELGHTGFFLIDRPYDNTPVGKPIGDLQILICDESGAPLPGGREGEIIIRGHFSITYFRDEQRTAKCMTPAGGGLTDYHTGDIGYLNENGDLVFMNRKDWMVKINGQRVETMEIETVLQSVPGVENAAVKAFTDADAQTYLAAYYVLSAPLSKEELCQALRAKLPEYMIPRFFVPMEALPKNANGKLDRTVLLPPTVENYKTKYSAPENEAEQALCKAFEQVLGCGKIGTEDDFFALGGDSIKVLRLIELSRVKGLTADMVFFEKTPKAIAALAKEAQPVHNAGPQDIPAVCPLNAAQLGVYIDCTETPESLKYNLTVRVKLPEGTDIPRFIHAVETAAARHPAFCVTIGTPDGVPSMLYHERKITVEEVSAESMEDELRRFVRPFDLEHGPLFRFEIVHLPKNDYFLYDVHHLVYDGSSQRPFLSRIAQVYDGGECREEAMTLFEEAAIEAQPKDPARQKNYREFFDRKFADVDCDTKPLPDRLAEGAPDTCAALYLNADENFRQTEVTDFVLKNGINENALFLGAFGYALAKCNGAKESFFNTANHGRRDARLADTVGMFVQMVPVICRFDEGSAPVDYLRGIYDDYHYVKNNDVIPFSELSAQYGANTDVSFIYQGDLLGGVPMADGTLTPENIHTDDAVCDIEIMLIRANGGYRINTYYRTALYTEKFIRGFIRLFMNAVRGMMASGSLGEIVLTDAESRAMLDGFNRTEAEYRAGKTTAGLFREQAAKTPDKTCLVYCDRRYTYRKVDELTDNLAAELMRRGVGTEKVVGVLIHRSEYMLICALGVLKAGGAYLPLDPTYPADRLNLMMQDSGAMLLIADADLDRIISSDFSGSRMLTDVIPALPKCSMELPQPKPEDLFIVLYTSGSTGTPKGVMYQDSNSFVTTQWVKKYFGIDENSRVTAYASYGFDANTFDMYPAVTGGAELHIISEEIRLDFNALRDYFNENGITHTVMTTQVGRQFAMMGGLKTLRHLSVAGEKLTPPEVPENFNLYNLYGPSEGSVITSAFRIDRRYKDVPIGKPVDNLKIYVVDAQGRLLPPGAVGELWIAGPHVTRGYLNRPEKTAEAYGETNPFDQAPDYQRMYRTGDIVRILHDGNLQYVGRRDAQVKIRGFRVELSEVEHVIRQFPGIKDATVIARDDPSGGKCLHAYVVSDDKVNMEALHGFIRSEKPPYMVPAATMQIDSIPLTPNQKVDKRRLPVIEIHFEDVTKPENELQQRIFDKVAEIVGTDSFGIDTDLFDAGVSSIGSIRLCALLAEEFGIPVQIRNLKKYPTVRQLEEFVKKSVEPEGEKNSETADNGYTADHPISKTMEGIFTECISRPDSTFYNIPYLVKLSEEIDEERLKQALADAVEAHPSMKAELYTDAEGRIRQHRRTGDRFTADQIKLMECGSIDEIRDTLVKPFKITGSMLFEISLIHADARYLFLNFHHIITDGTSIAIFLKDVESAYAGGKLKPETYSGFDVAEDEQRARTKEDLAEAKEYYAGLLEGLDRDFLPLGDRGQNAPGSGGRLIYTQRISSVEKIEKFCERNRVSMNAFFTGVFGFVLSRYAGAEYSVFNTVYNGRNDSRRANTFAMLVKTLPVVCNTEGGTPGSVIATLGTQLVDSMANDIFSYAEIARSFHTNNDVMFIFQGEGFERKTFCGKTAEEVPLTLSEAKTPIALQVMLKDGQVVCDLEYAPDRFTEKFMDAFLSAYDMACAGFAEEKELSRISLLSPEAEAEMETYNDTELDYDRDVTVTELFLKNVEKNPEKLCSVYKKKKLTYGDVGRLTGKAALFLMEKGIGRGDVVSILINRNENMIVTAHSVVRAGAAYVGLDPTYPSDRLAFMIKDSGSKLLIAERSLMNKLPDYEGPVLYTDEIDDLPELTKEKEEELRENGKYALTPENDVLIIYSSGTTGLPKGSVLQQKAIVCFYQNYIRDMLMDENTNVAAYASFGFDGGAMDVFSVPMVGGTLFVIPDEIRMDMKELERFYVRNAITNGFMTTQVGTMFISATKCRTLKAFMVGGEKLIPVMPPENVKFLNGYGPSETMCYVNRHRVTDTAKLQPIGKTNRNIKEYIVDKSGNRQPYGAIGELCISGGQMGRGYLNRPEKTAEAFVRNPFCSKKGYEKMYRTGDIVRMLPDGNYDFVGRNDGQVKIRGFRVELSEVEQQIRKFDGIEKCVVTAFDNPAGGKYLAAYIVSGKEIDIEELKKFIASEKPDYMVPAAIMRIDGIPLTANGKVDLRKLPKAELGSRKKGAEPADETEEKICGIFGEVLGLDKVYADDDFFAIGGSSISAIQVIVKCEQAGMAVVYKNLFANPTPQKLAAFLTGGKREDIVAADLEKGDGHDYSALKYNILPNLPKIRNNGVGDVLLTGATGFLGSHVFRELLTATDSKVICLVRSKPDMSAKEHLEMMLVYYFEDWYSEELDGRVTVIDGSVDDEEIRGKLKDIRFDTIINCAANVKHFAAGDELMNANFTGVENLISIAEEKGAKLIQISSLSVCGESVDGSVPAGYKFKETDLNIGQSLENKYIYTKYLAEQAIIDAVSAKRIRGKVIRLGNLMARAEDSLFQVNAGTNGFLRMFLGFSALGCFPIGMMDAEIEFSPIDAVAKAVVLLAGTPDEFTVFHAKNCNTIHYGYFLNAIRKLIRPIAVVEDDVFEKSLAEALKDEKNVERLGGLLAYRNDTASTMSDASHYNVDTERDRQTRVRISSDTAFTVKALYRLDFAWPLISTEYLDKMVEALADMNYFADESE